MNYIKSGPSAASTPSIKRVSVQLDTTFYKQIKASAKAADRSVSAYCAALLRTAQANH